jgi:glutathione S-transferase
MLNAPGVCLASKLRQQPNGWKVAALLNELGLTYETKYLDFKTGEHKAAAHTKLNPNGRSRLPSIGCTPPDV